MVNHYLGLKLLLPIERVAKNTTPYPASKQAGHNYISKPYGLIHYSQ